MTQYTFSLPLPALFSADNFVVSDCNRDAWRWIEAWPTWPAHAFLLHGASGSGKSHLSAIWAQRALAHALSADTLDGLEAGILSKGNWLIENIEMAKNERALLHLFNASREHGASLLLTSNVAAAQLPFALADLTSRLLALPAAQIEQPDDGALAGVMRKQFIDRQMKVDDEVIAYIIPRIERSFLRVKELVEQLDNAALAEHKNITIPFAKRILE